MYLCLSLHVSLTLSIYPLHGPHLDIICASLSSLTLSAGASNPARWRFSYQSDATLRFDFRNLLHITVPERWRNAFETEKWRDAY